MTALGFVCHSSYDCRCRNGDIISKRTAMSHRACSQCLHEQAGNISFLPLTREVHSLSELCESPSETSCNSDLSSDSDCASDRSSRNSSSSALVSYFSSTDSDSSYQCSDSSSACTHASSVSSDNPSDCETASVSLGSSADVNLEEKWNCNNMPKCDDMRFKSFTDKHAELIGMSIRHCATGSLIDALIKSLPRMMNPLYVTRPSMVSVEHCFATLVFRRACIQLALSFTRLFT